MSASIAIAASANANSAAALAIAAAARRDSCLAYMPRFKHEGATTHEIQYYAGCAREIYPARTPEQDAGFAIVMKIFIAFSLIGAIIGAVRIEKEEGWKYMDIFFGVILGAIFGAAVPFVAVLAISGVAYLFS